MSAILELSDVQAAYGRSQALFGVNLSLGAGEVVSLLGRNGMGKTTTVRAIMGLLPRTGSIRFAGEETASWPAHRIARAGMGLVPESREIFPNLSVRENLAATARALPAGGPGWNLERVFAMFPRLAERARAMGDQLSGGEQQMLAIGRALMTNPRLMLLDEATEGLAPMLRREIWEHLAELKRAGLAILVIDKELQAISAIADRHYMIERGTVVWEGDSAALRADHAARNRYLGI